MTFLSLILLAIPALIQAQTPDYKVVFDLTSKDTVAHQTVIRWLNEISKSTPDAQLEVVFYGKSLGMVVKDRSVVPEDITRMAQSKNISFKVCAIAMKNQNIQQAQLLPGVQIVPDGIYEVISKQKQGWGYIKVAP